MLSLPENAPNYVIYLETGRNSLHLDALRLHRQYIAKALNYPENRLPRILAEETIARNTFWAKSWHDICEEHRIDTSLNANLADANSVVLAKLREIEYCQFVERARQSTFHDLYCRLRFSNNYFAMGIYPSKMAGTIIRARSGLLNINARSFKKDTDGICTVCNLDEVENTLHFVAVCPLYKRIRTNHFGKSTLSESEVVDLLNGSNNKSLYEYLNEATKYRKLIISEFI